ncbi:MAG TPA: hypothetical protein VGF73_09315 [Chthoniobacterales bacterium]|jgi:glucose/arabinose dehydrogenase
MMMHLGRTLSFCAFTSLAFLSPTAQEKEKLLTGRAAMGDWTGDAPGVRRKITVADLPPPNDTRSADNGPRLVRRPPGAQLRVPPGFRIEEYASGFRDPRVLLTAPNGDIFVVESRADQIKVLRDKNADGNRLSFLPKTHSISPSASPFIRPAPIRITSTSRTRTV